MSPTTMVVNEEEEDDANINAEAKETIQTRRRSTRKRNNAEVSGKKTTSKTKSSKKKKKASKKAVNNELSDNTNDIEEDINTNDIEEDIIANIDESGKEEYLKLTQEMCKAQNEDMESSKSRAKTGVNFISQKKYDFLLKHLLLIEKWKGSNAMEKEEMRDEYELSSSKMKQAWKYQFRLKYYGETPKVQKPSWAYSKNKDKPKSIAQRYNHMKEDDWSDIVPCDSYECYKVMNKLHWGTSNTYSHHKGHSLFKLATEIDFAHNITNNICNIICAICPVCKVNIRKKKKKDKDNQETNNVEEQTVSQFGSGPKLVQYCIVRLSRALSDKSSMSLDVIVVAYLSAQRVDLLPLNNHDLFEIGGKLITSFMSNEIPGQLQQITREQFLFKPCITDDEVLTYVNTCLIPKSQDIISIDDMPISSFLNFAIKLLQDTFAFNSPLNCFVHTHAVLCYIKMAINVDGRFEKEDTVQWVFANYLNPFIEMNSSRSNASSTSTTALRTNVSSLLSGNQKDGSSLEDATPVDTATKEVGASSTSTTALRTNVSSLLSENQKDGSSLEDSTPVDTATKEVGTVTLDETNEKNTLVETHETDTSIATNSNEDMIIDSDGVLSGKDISVTSNKVQVENNAHAEKETPIPTTAARTNVSSLLLENQKDGSTLVEETPVDTATNKVGTVTLNETNKNNTLVMTHETDTSIATNSNEDMIIDTDGVQSGKDTSVTSKKVENNAVAEKVTPTPTTAARTDVSSLLSENQKDGSSLEDATHVDTVTKEVVTVSLDETNKKITLEVQVDNKVGAAHENPNSTDDELDVAEKQTPNSTDDDQFRKEISRDQTDSDDEGNLSLNCSDSQSSTTSGGSSLSDSDNKDGEVAGTEEDEETDGEEMDEVEDEKVVFEDEECTHLYSNLVPLVNEFNMCYLIATIQLLSRVPPLWKWLADEDNLNIPLTSPLSKKKVLRTGTLFMGGLIHAEFHKAHEQKRKPNAIKINTFNEARKVSLLSFHESNQEDVGEFLMELLNNFTETNDTSKSIFERNMNLHYQQIKKCNQCGIVKRAPVDLMSVYPVPINSSNLDGMDSLSNFIDKIFFNPMTMDQSAWVQCEKCNNEKTPTTENCIITQLPVYLFFNLIRYENKGNKTTKVEHDVKADRLITMKCEGKDEHDFCECTYYLQGVICHVGDGYKHGHYTTYLLEDVDGKIIYHFLNDKKHEVVTTEEFENKTKRSGYIYLYTKNKQSFFGRDPYLHMSMKRLDIQPTFLKGLLHERSKKNPPRQVKQSRKSDLHVVDPTQIKMTSFVSKRNKSSTNESVEEGKDDKSSTKESTDKSKDDITVIRRK